MATSYTNLNPDHFVDMALARKYRSTNFTTLSAAEHAYNVVDGYVKELTGLFSTLGRIYRSYLNKFDIIRDNLQNEVLPNVDKYLKSATNQFRSKKYYDGGKFSERENHQEYMLDMLDEIKKEVKTLRADIVDRQNTIKGFKEKAESYLAECKSIRNVIASKYNAARNFEE